MKQDSIHPTQLRLAGEALGEILRAEKPADAVLRELFAARRNAGAKDRARISGLVYAVLRNYFPLRAACGAVTPLELCAAQLLHDGAALPALRELDASAFARPSGKRPLTAAQQHNLPDWLWQKLARDFGDEASALARALNQPATVDLRVNTLKASREAARAALAAERIAAAPTPRAPLGLRLSRRVALQSTRPFRDGWVEPQDEGSQLLALHVAAQPGETVVDFCAGAGGKTLALGALMQNRGELHALDASGGRLARLAPRQARAGLRIVRAHVLRDAHDPWLQHLAGRADAVLVDAPCSATGTLRRNPELRLRTPDLVALAATQRSILHSAAALVRPGGRLVYATCSVLREENEDVVADFLAARADFTRGAELRLLPHRDGTDGFYAATLNRSR